MNLSAAQKKPGIRWRKSFFAKKIFLSVKRVMHVSGPAPSQMAGSVQDKEEHPYGTA